MLKGKKKYLTIALIGIILIGIGYLGYDMFVASKLEFQENERLFLEGVKKYYDFNPTKLPSVNGYREVSLDDMYDGKWVEILKVDNKLCDGTSFMRVINDNGNYRYITYLKCDKYVSSVDSIKPEIILNGEDTVIVHLNTTYQDSGIKEVKDNKDKLTSSDVVIDTSKVDTSKVGTYKVDYKVYDKTYNVGKTSRTVIVAETLSDNIKRNKGANYTYTGDINDNFVLFSGMMFRIVNVDNEGNIKLITDNPISNVSYGDGDYKESNIYTWLNEYFYNHLNENSKKYMKEVTWCYDYQENAGIIDSCNNSVNAKVGLLSVSEYEKAKSAGYSYLMKKLKFSMINKKNESSIWINDISYSNGYNNMSASDILGVRPVIVLDKSIFLTGGNGTMEDPFKLQDYTYGKENNKLSTRLIGEYVHFSGYDFRISGIDDDGNIKLTAADLLTRDTTNGFVTISYKESDKLKPDVNEEGNLYHKLNNEALNYLTEDLIIKHEYEIPQYTTGTKYKEYKKTTITSKISLPASYEMFSSVNSYANNNIVYWLSDYTEDGLAGIVNTANGIAFNLNYKTFPKNGIKPVIYLKSNAYIVSGKGTVSEPYFVR